MILMTSKKLVVDRAGFGYSCRVNCLVVANLNSRFAEYRAIPKLLANQNSGGSEVAASSPCPDHNERMRFNMADQSLQHPCALAQHSAPCLREGAA